MFFFDKFSLNFKNELLINGEESKKILYYTHQYVENFGFNFLKDFYYFNHEVNTFILLYPLYSSEVNSYIFDYDFIFYHKSFKVELSYSDIPFYKKNVENNNIINESKTELNLSEFLVLQKKKEDNLFFFCDDFILSDFDNKNTFLINIILKEENENEVEDEKNNQIKEFFNFYPYSITGENIVNDDFIESIKQQKESKKFNGKKNIIKKKFLNNYHHSMVGFDRTYIPPTVRDNERKHIF